jgi:hypothetical protein
VWGSSLHRVEYLVNSVNRNSCRNAGDRKGREDIPGMNRIPVPTPVKAIIPKIAGRFPEGSITVPSASGDQVWRG